MRPLRRMAHFTRHLWPYYLGIVACGLVTSAATIAVPFVIGRATDVVVGVARGGPADDLTRTGFALGAALLLATVATTVVGNVGGYLGDVMSSRMRSSLSQRYYERLLALPQRYFDDELTGTIINRLSRSITSVTDFVKSFSNSFFPMLVTTVAVLAISAWYFWPLTVLLAVMFPLYFWLTTLTSARWQVLEHRKNADLDEASGRFAEVVGQVRVVRSFVREVAELRRFSTRFDATIDTTRAQSRHWHRMDVLRGAILDVIFVAGLAMVFVLTARGEFSVGDMVILVQLMTMARQPVSMLSYIVDSGQRALTGSVDYVRVMDEPLDRTGPVTDVVPARRERRPGAPMIRFDHVRFGYTDTDVLHDVSFDVAPGERVALVSESGGGKTTLVNLLLGLYTPRGGRIDVAGHDIAGLGAVQLRSDIGVVFQDASLFSGTVRENIAYGRPDATDADIAQAARRANAADFIARLPGGYDAVIGERGLKLSGGQKQRIAVARALLKDAPILVLDEATSALDTKSERLVQAGLDELMAGRTSLVIAHRLSTIAAVDRIVTLRDGRVDEIGTPAELAVSGGIYAELLALQNSTDAAARKHLRDRFALRTD
ncbi:ABC transporter ATP-binding protein [Agilicoccus flavus]|uniref:ABC transporter ATP-binding protein n=1 Tax=Agilicoccus flavus TaxID=2775968 RepID=UPI0035560330